MRKRFRRPKVTKNQLKVWWGRGHTDAAPDLQAGWGAKICVQDAHLIMNSLAGPRYGAGTGEQRPSLLDELRERGYDLETIKFSIEKLPSDEVPDETDYFKLS